MLLPVHKRPAMTIHMTTAHLTKEINPMTNVVAFPQRKPKRTVIPVSSWPSWKQELFNQWRDSERWVIHADGARWFNIPHAYAAIMPVAVVVDGEEDVWWSYFVFGARQPRQAWFEPTDAEAAAWDALLRVVERRQKRGLGP
jgi:hypothetical protein